MPKEEYGAKDLSVLEGLDAVRKRPGMYIGTTDSQGLMHCLWEIIDNSVDEALAGFCNNIVVTLHTDGSVEVADNGRGIPVDKEPKTGLSGVEVVLTKLHAGAKFGNSSYNAVGGLHGVGSSVVNALSSRLDVEVDRDGKTHHMAFHQGHPGVYADADPANPSPDSPFKRTRKNKPTELEIIGKVSPKTTGTRIRYWYDPEIFNKTAEFSYEQLIDRVRQTSFLVPGLKITIVDENVPEANGADTVGTEPNEDVAVVAESLNANETTNATESFSGEDSPLDGFAELSDDASVDGDTEAPDEEDFSLSSATEVVDGAFGEQPAHPRTVEFLHTGGVKDFVDFLSKGEPISDIWRIQVERDDIQAGLVAVVTARVAEPQFQGQTKDVLGTAQVKPIVTRLTDKQFGEMITGSKRGYKEQSARVLEKIVGEMHARIQSRKAKEVTRRKNALESASMPAKLSDCQPGNDDVAELFIVEGDSALGTAKAARNAGFQALLPIRGKILNVQKASITQMLSNKECAAIIQVVGAGSGQSFDIEQSRYHKIIMMTDADVDGAHIRILLLTLFYRYMRPLIEHGYVYAAVPPLHRIALTGSHKGEYIYTYSDDELAGKLADLDKKRIGYNDDIQRYKGLGEMDADQLADTTMDPRTRMLRRIRMEDAAQASEIFNLLMGDEVPPRKQFIVDNADDFDRSKIDT